MSDALAPTLQATLGQVRVVSDEPGRSAIEYEVGPQMCHSGGVAQGGFVCAWIDTAMAHASISLAPQMTPMSLDLKVNGFAEGRLVDLQGRVLAKASSTIRLIPREAVEASARRALG
jgi:acyl-coenzyme A thioesterase PaaI-like protein